MMGNLKRGISTGNLDHPDIKNFPEVVLVPHFKKILPFARGQ